MAKISTDLQVKNARAKSGERFSVYKIESYPGLQLRVFPSGQKTWSLAARIKALGGGKGKMTTVTLGSYPALSLADAKRKSAEIRDTMRAGTDPVAEAAAKSPENVIEAEVGETGDEGPVSLFIRRYAKERQKSWVETQRVFDVYVLPRWKGRPLGSIRRKDVVELLDAVEDNNGPVMADRTLAMVRKMFNWHMTRDENLVSPIIKGMARTQPSERARDRVLGDAELRAFWRATARMNTFGRMVRVLLLTATRRREAADMTAGEIEGDVWTIPAARYKTGVDHAVTLTALARVELDALLPARAARKRFVFSHDEGGTPVSGFSKFKAKLDVVMLEELRREDPGAELPHWTVHDLRRTARTLMTRVGVSDDHAERVLGHVIGGVRGVYNRHAYIDEKRGALEKLAAAIAGIVGPAGGNVVPLVRVAT